VPAPRDGEPVFPGGLTEDERDFVDPISPLDIDALREAIGRWCDGRDASVRWQCGVNVSEAPLGPVFAALPPAVRNDLYLRERALHPDRTPDWEIETWSSRWGRG